MTCSAIVTFISLTQANVTLRGEFLKDLSPVKLLTLRPNLFLFDLNKSQGEKSYNHMVLMSEIWKNKLENTVFSQHSWDVKIINKVLLLDVNLEPNSYSWVILGNILNLCAFLVDL